MKVEIHPGRLPDFGDRSVLFFGNLLSLFWGNDAGADELRRNVSGVEWYGGRLVPLIDLLFPGGENVLFIDAAPDPAVTAYLRNRVGLSLPAVYELPDATRRLLAWSEATSPLASTDGALLDAAQRGPALVDGFVTDRAVEEIARRLAKRSVNSSDGSKRANDKYLLHSHLESEGAPVFDTELAHSIAGVPELLASLRGRGYRNAVFKARIGASGIGLVKLPTEIGVDEVRARVPEYLFHETPCMVQGWLDDSLPGVAVIGSPSVQIWVDEEGVHLFDLTDQILSSGSLHEGNRSPPPYAPFGSPLAERIFAEAAKAAVWLHREGYRGTASADCLVVRHGTETTVYVCELNARVTGATYPSVVARHLRPDEAWILRNLRWDATRSSEEVLARLDADGLLYPSEDESGILPLNIGLGDGGRLRKGQFLVLGGNVDECEHALARAGMALGWAHDRD